MIKNYFKRLSREQLEVKALLETQSRRLRMEEEKKRLVSLGELRPLVEECLTSDRTENNNQIIEIVDLEDEDDSEIIDNVSQNQEAQEFRDLEEVTQDESNKTIATIDIPVVFSSIEPAARIKRRQNKRPSNWVEIASDYNMFRMVRRSMTRFGLTDINPSVAHWTTILGRWVKEWKSDKIIHYKRTPIYGCEIDKALVDEVQRYNSNGVPMTDIILRFHLIELLKTHNRLDILSRLLHDHEDSQGKDSRDLRFGKRWAQRFYQRNQLRCRVVTTKMRDEVPIDYEIKKDQFILHLSKAIHFYNIPLDLICGGDETNTQFVPSIKRTRCKRGTRKVRIVGVGHEKPQITVTFSATATGIIIAPVQLIFGGKTKACHPHKGKVAPPIGIYYDQTTSHWQTPLTFLVYITKVLIPYRLQTVKRLNLPIDQKMVYILDLHYSHKDENVLKLFANNDIIPIFIPAGCTDLHQVCDVAINKPYKNGVTAKFVDYVTSEFYRWSIDSTRSPGEIFKLNLAGSAMKPLIPSFVSSGIERVSSEHMQQTIKTCFLNEGLLGIALLPETYQRALISLPGDETVTDFREGEVEDEELLGPVPANEGEDELEPASFLLQVTEIDDDDETVSASSDDEDDESSLEEVPINIPDVLSNPEKRIRTRNTMVGSLKRGKYSKL